MTHKYFRQYKAGNTIRLLKLERLEEFKNWIAEKQLTKDDVKLIRRGEFLFLTALKDMEVEFEYVTKERQARSLRRLAG